MGFCDVSVLPLCLKYLIIFFLEEMKKNQPVLFTEPQDHISNPPDTLQEALCVTLIKT